jgi:hypothetical protein
MVEKCCSNCRELEYDCLGNAYCTVNEEEYGAQEIEEPDAIWCTCFEEIPKSDAPQPNDNSENLQSEVVGKSEARYEWVCYQCGKVERDNIPLGGWIICDECAEDEAKAGA